PVLTRGDPLGIAEVLADHRALGDERRERPLRVTLDPARLLVPDDSSDAGERGAERYVPEPAAVKGGAQDVAGVGLGQALATLKVAEQREAAEELGILPGRSGPLIDAAAVARGVDHVLRADGSVDAAGVRVNHAGDPVPVLEHVRDRVLLADIHAHMAGVIEQDLVELAPLDLVGV